MNKFIFSFFVLSAVVFDISSAETLVEACPSACKAIYDLMKEKKKEMPECSKDFMNDNLKDDQEWDCFDLKDFILAVADRAEDKKAKGKEKEFKNCVSSVSEMMATEDNLMAVGKKVSEDCNNKLESIINYLIEESGFLDM